jgi:hypothetical protein
VLLPGVGGVVELEPGTVAGLFGLAAPVGGGVVEAVGGFTEPVGGAAVLGA